jgi:hypothetical protein
MLGATLYLSLPSHFVSGLADTALHPRDRTPSTKPACDSAPRDIQITRLQLSATAAARACATGLHNLPQMALRIGGGHRISTVRLYSSRCQRAAANSQNV